MSQSRKEEAGVSSTPHVQGCGHLWLLKSVGCVWDFDSGAPSGTGVAAQLTHPERHLDTAWPEVEVKDARGMGKGAAGHLHVASRCDPHCSKNDPWCCSPQAGYKCRLSGPCRTPVWPLGFTDLWLECQLFSEKSGLDLCWNYSSLAPVCFSLCPWPWELASSVAVISLCWFITSLWM
jgi:hypothetical protein